MPAWSWPVLQRALPRPGRLRVGLRLIVCQHVQRHAKSEAPARVTRATAWATDTLSKRLRNTAEQLMPDSNCLAGQEPKIAGSSPAMIIWAFAPAELPPWPGVLPGSYMHSWSRSCSAGSLHHLHHQAITWQALPCAATEKIVETGERSEDCGLASPKKT